MNASGLSLRDLEYVVALAEEGHFGRAAERCAVSQPTLSVQVRKLEEALGLVLFERSNRRVLLTPSGQAVVRQARAVLAEAKTLLMLAREGAGQGLRGRLVLAAIQTLGPYLFPQVLRGLRQAFPDLALALSEGRTAEILDALREGRADAALISLPIPDSGLTVAPLFDEPFLLACPAEHAFAGGEAPRPGDLAGPDLLLLDEGNCLRDQAVAACGAGPATGRHATSLETLRSMVAAGAGYTLLPALAAPPGPDPAGLTICRRFGPDGPRRTIALAWRASDPRTEGLAELAGFFRAHAPHATLPLGQPAEAGTGRDTGTIPV
ncbi:LysR family transcriptional regulator, hydrogen peroxide-inducible genes activator [Methylobacterium sp. 174MFSha1.1]|uniref:LysR substrate-binding domain-containing protein n=1 Tax=Methylobacterium sp. 174MFSha1.1 TaxID=1502749 RepID=UPI0008EAD953|nr:LysR substrate-binding domain-containing protein [Methylobacterium sp. 174MFSha1.1]SFV10843.1 LysR family transcriptional regulator, hydrogen peroxide-inducible genes activator [Methylobacterium sp. 174MFSha1.1]